MLLALVTTGLRRSELCALEWRDLDLDGRKRSLLVRCGKGGKPRRQPVPAGLARELSEPPRHAAARANRSRCSAASPADGCRRRSSPTSSAAPRLAPGSTNTSPPTRCATPPRRGYVRSAATRASSLSTSATPTSRLSPAMRTSTATSSSTQRGGSSKLLIRGIQASLNRVPSRATPALHAASRIGQFVAAVVVGGGAAVERPNSPLRGDSLVWPHTRRATEWLSAARISSVQGMAREMAGQTPRTAAFPPD